MYRVAGKDWGRLLTREVNNLQRYCDVFVRHSDARCGGETIQLDSAGIWGTHYGRPSVMSKINGCQRGLVAPDVDRGQILRTLLALPHRSRRTIHTYCYAHG